MKPVIAVLGTLDTKGQEHAFLADQIRHHGCDVWLIDVGTGSPPQVAPNASRFDVARAAGIELEEIVARRDRGEAIHAMTLAAPVYLEKLFRAGKIHGVIALGGGGGTAIASAAMRALPIGFPKLIVSTLAAGQTAHYVGTKDITLMPSVVDIQGINRLTRLIFQRAAGGIVGMVRANVTSGDEKPIIVASMFGNTTACIHAAIPILEGAGYEVLVFAATGTGGRAMESLIESGLVAGVLDITTTELADECVGGVLSAGPDRLKGAGKARVPAIVAPGCLDMVNFGEPSTVPSRFRHRRFYQHNPQVTLMRTTAEECRQLAGMLASAVNTYVAPTTVLIPQQAISVVSAPEGPFHDPEADAALFDGIEARLDRRIPRERWDLEINDPRFAQVAATRLLENIHRWREQSASGGSLPQSIDA